MALSTAFFLLCCLGFYKLGAFNSQHPGQLWQNMRFFGHGLWKWMNQ